MKYFNQEKDRIKSVYAKRTQKNKDALYSWHSNTSHINKYRYNIVLAKALKHCQLHDLRGRNILDVGCGSGSIMQTLIDWGADPKNVMGTEILSDRITKAKSKNPNLNIIASNGWPIEVASDSMDLVIINVVLSSILNTEARKSIYEELKRIVKPKGHILIYDFKVSDPRNKDTIGIKKKEIRQFMEPLVVRKQFSFILLPFLSRKVSSVSPLIALLMESIFPFLKTHRMYILS